MAKYANNKKRVYQSSHFLNQLSKSYFVSSPKLLSRVRATHADLVGVIWATMTFFPKTPVKQ